MDEPSATHTVPCCWVLVGPTASGKSDLGRELARRHGAEIVSADSMKIYRGMDIGTAKPSAAVRTEIPHHMINVADPEESFNVARYCRMAKHCIEQIAARGKRPFLVGGSALYLKGLIWGLFEGPTAEPDLRRSLEQEAELKGSSTLHHRLAKVDPEAARRIHPNDAKRIVRALEVYELTGVPISSQQVQFTAPPQLPHVMIGLRRPREELHARIEKRVDRMVATGLLDEVAALRGRLGPQASQALGYKELLQHLRRELDLAAAMGLIKQHTRQFAKHQLTWFRQFPDVNWIDAAGQEQTPELAEKAERVLVSHGLDTP